MTKERGVTTCVNGDAGYNARTTRRAASLLLEGSSAANVGVMIDQTVDTPIGSGFGASAAAATSAVYATASILGIEKEKRELALFAHRAEILEQTGLGTVSVIFDSKGAGAIIAPGEPGVAEFINVEVPRGTRIVTAFFAPFDKKDALSSKVTSEKINRYGHEALLRFLDDPTLDNLAANGEKFSSRLGLESKEVKKAISVAKSAGALHASQNMIGYSVHSVLDSENEERVVEALKGLGKGVRVDSFEVGRVVAGVVPSRR